MPLCPEYFIESAWSHVTITLNVMAGIRFIALWIYWKQKKGCNERMRATNHGWKIVRCAHAEKLCYGINMNMNMYRIHQIMPVNSRRCNEKPQQVHILTLGANIRRDTTTLDDTFKIWDNKLNAQNYLTWIPFSNRVNISSFSFKLGIVNHQPINRTNLNDI